MATVAFTAAELQALAKELQPLLDTPAPVPPPVVVPPAGVFWVYYNGQFNWQGDYSFGTGSINYQDTAGKPLSGQFDIAVPITSKWGGFQPFAPGGKFDTSPYKYLIYSLKPTVASQIFATGFAGFGDVADGNPVIVAGPAGSKYGPVPEAGVWGTYKIPLVDFALSNPLILKFSIADSTGLDTNLFYVDNVGFSA
jgi:hypothetical protein